MAKKLKKIKRALRRPFEWLGIGLGWLVLAHLPRRAMLGVCDMAAFFMYHLDRKGRRHAEENLDAIFGDGGLSPDAREKIVRRSYRNMARAVGHAFWTCRNAAERVAASGEMSPEGHAFLAANRPAVTVSGHIGCWEILSQLAYLEGHRMMSVAKDIGSDEMWMMVL